MNKMLALKLVEKAQDVADRFSQDREFNYDQEKFTFSHLIPQETTALVFYKKSTGKIAVAFFYWINGGGGYWQYFFPTATHVVGMEQVRLALLDVEKHNFPFNFDVMVEAKE